MAGLAKGVDHSKQVIVDVCQVAVDGVGIFKKMAAGVVAGGGVWAIGAVVVSSVRDFVVLYEDSKDLVKELPLAMPEVKALDAEEIGMLGSALYENVRGAASKIFSLKSLVVSANPAA